MKLTKQEAHEILMLIFTLELKAKEFYTKVCKVVPELGRLRSTPKWFLLDPANENFYDMPLISRISFINRTEKKNINVNKYSASTIATWIHIHNWKVIIEENLKLKSVNNSSGLAKKLNTLVAFMFLRNTFAHPQKEEGYLLTAKDAHKNSKRFLRTSYYKIVVSKHTGSVAELLIRDARECIKFIDAINKAL